MSDFCNVVKTDFFCLFILFSCSDRSHDDTLACIVSISAVCSRKTAWVQKPRESFLLSTHFFFWNKKYNTHHQNAVYSGQWCSREQLKFHLMQMHVFPFLNSQKKSSLSLQLILTTMHDFNLENKNPQTSVIYYCKLPYHAVCTKLLFIIRSISFKISMKIKTWLQIPCCRLSVGWDKRNCSGCEKKWSEDLAGMGT